MENRRKGPWLGLQRGKLERLNGEGVFSLETRKNSRDWLKTKRKRMGFWKRLEPKRKKRKKKKGSSHELEDDGLPLFVGSTYLNYL